MLIFNPSTDIPKTLIKPTPSFYTSMKAAVAINPVVDFVNSFKNDVYVYCDLLKVTPNPQQRELLDAYQAGEPRIACRAGKGPGKSMATAIVLSHWSVIHPNSKLIVTAPTFRQCKKVWMAQVQKLVTATHVDKRLKELFTFRGSGFGILGAADDMWGCQLVTALKKQAFQGQHEHFLAFLEEEASGVPEEISEAILETLSNQKGTFLHIRIGNPNVRNNPFFDSFHKEAHRWKKLHWNTEETPETPYFSKRRNEEIAEEFGRTSDIYRISVLGEFPSLDPNCLISEEDLDACCTKETLMKVMQENTDRSKQIGLDLARYGGDECVTVWRRGGVMYEMWAEKTDPNNAVDKAVAGQMLYGWEDDDCIYCVDTSGMGEAVVGMIGGANRMGKNVHEFYSQNTAVESNKYHDKITEAWCHFAKLVKTRMVYLGERLDKKLKTQLTTRRYVVTKKGLIKIESKDEYKKNNEDSENGTIGKSPDRADGVVMAFYPHATTSVRVATG